MFRALRLLARPATHTRPRWHNTKSTTTTTNTPPTSSRFGNTSLRDFIDPRASTSSTSDDVADEAVPYLSELRNAQSRAYYVETYGCQMNVADSELVHGVLQKAGFRSVASEVDADIVLLNTCAIRDKAEARIWTRLHQLRALKKSNSNAGSRVVIGLLGCMAERLKDQLLEKDRLVDVVCGPDAYRALPRLLADVADDDGATAINVQLSVDETYADIAPVRESSNGVAAFVTIMRGCNNMCTYCIVPFTRGRERSRPLDSIVRECVDLYARGYREVTLLGQNVNSYNFVDGETSSDDTPSHMTPRDGFKTVYKAPQRGVTFAELVDAVSAAVPNMRIRFTSPHPKDFPDELIELVRTRPNVCAQLHVPAQSGSSSVLERMRRGYTRETYLALVSHIRERIPGVALSTDMISGFCGETPAEHADTLSLMREVAFEQAFLFAYSLREKTPAHRRYADDVPEDVKKARLAEVIATFRELAQRRNAAEIGRLQTILVEARSRRSENEWMGRTDRNRKCIVGEAPLPLLPDDCADPQAALAALERGEAHSFEMSPVAPGQYVICRATSAAGAVTLRGTAIARVNSLALATKLTEADSLQRQQAEQHQQQQQDMYLESNAQQQQSQKLNVSP